MREAVRLIWRELARLERELSNRWGSSLYGHDPLTRQPGRASVPWGLRADELSRVERVREAVRRSKPYAAQRLAERLGGIDLSEIWRILIDLCEEIALYFGGAVVLGGAIGGIAGSFAGGVGALPGAFLGAGVGAKAGGWVLALLGLKSLVEELGDVLPRAIECYRIGFLEAWGDSPGRRHNARKSTGNIHFAASSMAEGHVILILSLLGAMVAYLTRGRGSRSQLLKEVRESPSLGPRMADWLEKNEAKLREHPRLRPRQATAAPIAQSASPVKPRSGPALTPSQLRVERRSPKPDEGGRKPPRRPGPPRMAPHEVPCFRKGKGNRASNREYDRQLADQEKALNKMSIEDYQKARELYKQRGRHPEAAAENANIRKRFQAEITEKLRDQKIATGMSESQALAQAVKESADMMKGLDALHNPDLIMGGNHIPTGIGDASANRSIGGQWPQNNRVIGVDRAVEQAAASQGNKTIINVRLKRCK